MLTCALESLVWFIERQHLGCMTTSPSPYGRYLTSFHGDEAPRMPALAWMRMRDAGCGMRDASVDAAKSWL